MTTAPASNKIDAYVWRISAVVIVGSIMSILDTTIVNVALATLGRELHSTIDQIQWVVTGYLLSLAAVIPVTGWAARRFGAKRVYIISLVLFTAGSALCGLASSTTALILFRVLQGIGGGMILPIGQLMMAEAAGPKRMGRVMSIVAVPAMLAPILGPTIGGLILDNASWQLDLLRQRSDRTHRGDRGDPDPPQGQAPADREARRPRLRTAGHRAAAADLRAGGDRRDRQFTSPKVVVPDHRRHRPDRSVRVARAADQEPAARPAPVPQARRSHRPRSRCSASAPRCLAA